MQQQQNPLIQIGFALLLMGIAVFAAIFFAGIIAPLATGAIVLGIILVIIGLATPGRG